MWKFISSGPGLKYQVKSGFESSNETSESNYNLDKIQETFTREIEAGVEYCFGIGNLCLNGGGSISKDVSAEYVSIIQNDTT